MKVIEPRVAIRQPPRENSFDRAMPQNILQVVAVHRGDRSIAGGYVGGQRGVIHIQFGDEDFQPEPLD